VLLLKLAWPLAMLLELEVRLEVLLELEVMQELELKECRWQVLAVVVLLLELAIRLSL